MLTALLPLAATLLTGTPGSVPATRSIDAMYVATVEAVPAGLHRLEVWVPVPASTANQEIRDVRVESPYPGSLRREKENGNSYFYFSTDDPRPGPLEIRVRFQAERREVLRAALRADAALSADELKKSLQAEPSVVILPRVRELARQVTFGQTTPEAKIRAIYDYLVNTMIYDKTVPGWGKGDIDRACDVKRGNCTDFHSLFMAMARAEGIPVRFIMGFPLKKDPEGTIPGYHCWAEFYVKEKGWIPVDASEASKSSDWTRRDYLFGNLDPDRVQFTTGRDLRLDPPPCAETLNYFIYPYAEGDGNALTPVAIRLEYRDRASGGGAAGTY
ncbi:MAG TPA: transglutaminase domain-containing protein [Thermoanaerobaculia bacterium]|jgi:transglutaminase-like putative cysteine protease